MKSIKIAFLDIVGLKYDGDTLNKRGLGGSESATIYMSKDWRARLRMRLTLTKQSTISCQTLKIISREVRGEIPSFFLRR